MTGLHAAFVVCAVLAALGVVAALLRGAEAGDPLSAPGARPDEEGVDRLGVRPLSTEHRELLTRADDAIAEIGLRARYVENGWLTTPCGGITLFRNFARMRERKSALERDEKIPHSLNGWNLPPA